MKWTSLLLLLCALTSHAQVPDILWQKGIGGSGTETPLDIKALPDGGYIVATTSNSPISATKSEAWGSFDVWILRLDSAANVLWEHSYGGSDPEYNPQVIPSGDGGYYVACYTISGSTGNKSVGNIGSNDIWIFKIDMAGNIEWQKAYGGLDSENLTGLLTTSTGDILVSAHSLSGIGGNKTVGNYGDWDIWFLKLDASGELIWQTGAGSSDWDLSDSNCLRERANGHYIMACSSYGDISGDKTEDAIGNNDFWVLEFDTAGNLLWQETAGGNSFEDLGTLINTADGGFIIAGSSYSSISGDKTQDSYGVSDYWLVKFATDGSIEWDKTIGAAVGDDGVTGLVEWPDGSLVITGTSQSYISGDKTEGTYGSFDYWVVRIDSNQDIIWQKTFGGNGGEYFNTFLSDEEYRLLIVGTSLSGISGNKTVGNNGSADLWFIQLAPDFICADTEISIDSLIYDDVYVLADGSIADTAGIYVVVIPGPGCDTVYTYNLGFLFTPVANFTYTSTLLETSFIDLSDNEPDSWTWYFGDGATSTEQNPVHTYSSPGSYAVCLNVSNDAGSDFDCAFIEVEDIGEPLAEFSVVTIGDTTFFTDLSLPEATSWIWLFGDGSISTEQHPSHVYGISGNYPVCLKAANASGSDVFCDLVQVCVRYTIELEGESVICEGSSTMLISNMTGAAAFQWRKDGLPFAIPGSSFASAEVTDPGLYSLYYIDFIGCSGSTNSVLVEASPLPEVSLVFEDTTLCRNDGLVALSGGLPVGGTYSGIGITDGIHINTAGLMPGTYTITYTYSDSLGCSSNATDDLSIILNPPASATVGSASNNLCVNDPVVLLANSGTGYTYQWYRNNILLPGETSLAYLATIAGNYTVEVSNAEGCSKRSGKRKVVSSGCRLADADVDADLIVYPNPNTGTFQYVWRAAELQDETLLVQLINSNGQMVYHEMISASDGMAAGSISLTLASGTYLLRLMQQNGHEKQQVISILNE